MMSSASEAMMLGNMYERYFLHIERWRCWKRALLSNFNELSLEKHNNYRYIIVSKLRLRRIAEHQITFIKFQLKASKTL